MIYLLPVCFALGFAFAICLAAWLQDRDEKRHNPFKGR